MSIFQILEFRPRTTLGQSLEQLSIDQDGLVWLVVVYRVGNFLDRNFSKLPLLYETINTFHHSLYCIFFSSQGCSGKPGWSWDYFCLRIIFQVYTLYEEVLIQTQFQCFFSLFSFLFLLSQLAKNHPIQFLIVTLNIFMGAY